MLLDATGVLANLVELGINWGCIKLLELVSRVPRDYEVANRRNFLVEPSLLNKSLLSLHYLVLILAGNLILFFSSC
jgi:hypothetical protein